MGQDEDTEKRKVFVLGQQMADALEKERQREAKGDIGVSPLPQEEYPLRSEELGLLDPVPNQLDEKLRNVCHLFRSLNEQERIEFRKRVSLNEFYTLLTFARRSSVFALRERSPDVLSAGILAVCMIEAERTDFRDILMALSLLHHSATRIGINPDEAFHAAEQLAEPRVRDLLAGFVRRTAVEKDISKSWGYKEVTTERGPGYVDWGFCRYKPKRDLLKAATRIAGVVSNDKYVVTSLTLAGELPDVWLRGSDASDLAAMLKDTKGVASLHAHLDSQYHEKAAVQMLLVFLAELGKPSSAQRLLQITRLSQPKSHCMLAIASGPLFCLLVARSVMMGVDGYESAESLRRFEQPIAAILSSV
ncbi:MAG: hypothetical protein JW753_00330 [Dehalococcoidia bacterium]|nr:hypothetical protein [Dehalococcoidia bacterium]